MKRTKGSQKMYWEMTADELAEATKEFDKPLSPRQLKPLSKAERIRFQKALRAGGTDVIRVQAFGD